MIKGELFHFSIPLLSPTISYSIIGGWMAEWLEKVGIVILRPQVQFLH